MKTSLPRVHSLNACDLDATEPTALVLDALDLLAPGEQLCVLIERESFSLYRHLSDRACAYCTRVLANTLVEVTIWRCGTQAII